MLSHTHTRNQSIKVYRIREMFEECLQGYSSMPGNGILDFFFFSSHHAF